MNRNAESFQKDYNHKLFFKFLCTNFSHNVIIEVHLQLQVRVSYF